MNNLGLSILKSAGISNLLATCSNKKFVEIKYFHPQGEILKNGVYIYKGFFLGECSKNSQAFTVNPVIKAHIGNTGENKGGILIFPENIVFSNEMIVQVVDLFFLKIKKENPYGYVLDNCFHGSYVSPERCNFGKFSLTLEVYGLGYRELLKLADTVFNSLEFCCIVVRDFNTNKFYYKSK